MGLVSWHCQKDEVLIEGAYRSLSSLDWVADRALKNRLLISTFACYTRAIAKA